MPISVRNWNSLFITGSLKFFQSKAEAFFATLCSKAASLSVSLFCNKIRNIKLALLSKALKQSNQRRSMIIKWIVTNKGDL